MNLKPFYIFGFFCVSLLTAISVNAQTGVCTTVFSPMANTAHTITLNGANPMPAAGTYTLTIKYVDENGLDATINSTSAVVSSSGGQLIITDNSVSFPSLSVDNFEFIQTYGLIQFSNSGGSYYWRWTLDQITCGPLPVTLTFFGGQNYTAGAIKIIWNTEDESNLSKYVIERSSDAMSFFCIGQVTPQNTSGTHSYTFYDMHPYPVNFYRLKTVELDGSFTYSNIIHINCSTCNGVQPPMDCSQIAISGPSTVCYGSGIYNLTGVPGCGNATWSVSNTNIAIITTNATNSLQSSLQKVSDGTVIISATVPGCSATFTKTVTVGSQPLYTYTNVYQTQSYTRYTVVVSNPTGGSGSYNWYSDNSFVGTGYSWYYDVYPSYPVYYQVTKYDSCGAGSSSGYLYYQALPPIDPCIYYKTVQSAGSGSIILRRLPCDYIPARTMKPKPSLKKNFYEVALNDFQGNTKIHLDHVSLDADYKLNVKGLLPGFYVLNISRFGVIQYTKKIRID